MKPDVWRNPEINVYAISEEGAKNFRCIVPLYSLSTIRKWLERELASLRHDIERAVQRNTELLAENESMRAEKERAEREVVYWRDQYYGLVTKMQEEGNIPYGN